MAFLLLSQALAAQPAELAAKSEQAKSLMAEGRFKEAAGIYEALIKAVPGNPGLLLNLGMALHMAGDDKSAIPPLEAALRIQPVPPAMLFLGASYLRTGQPGKAIPPLKRFVAAEPNHKEARQMLADAAAMTGNHAESAVHLRKLSEWEPDQPRIWYALGRAYQELAASLFSKLPAESGYWLALAGDARDKQSQARAGFLLYRKAIEKLPKQRGLHAGLAEIYKRAGREDLAAAETKLEAGLGLPVCKPTPTLECHFLSGRHERVLASAAVTQEALYWKIRAADALSRQAFARLMSLPESVHSLRFQAETARDEGRHKEAAGLWRSALAKSPGDPTLEFELGSSLAAAKDFDAAQEILTRLLAADSAAPELNFLQGDILLNLQQPEKAIAFLEKAVKADPKHLPSRASLGRALVLAGRGAEAVPHLEAALPADSDGGLHFQLVRAYQAAGKTDLAKQTLVKYQEIQKKLEEEKRLIEQESQITVPPPAP